MNKLKKLLCFLRGTHDDPCNSVLTHSLRVEGSKQTYGWKCNYCKTQSKDYPKEGLTE